jgi:hypothetical protein
LGFAGNRSRDTDEASRVVPRLDLRAAAVV